MKIFCLLIPIFLICAQSNVFSSADQSIDLQQILENDFTAGKISQAQRIAYEIMALSQPENLPSHYQKYKPKMLRSGTNLRAQAKIMLPTLSGTNLDLLSSVLVRPSRELLPESVVSPTGLFRIHFTFNGSNASTREYVEQVALTFDEVYDFEVNTLGYNPPPPDFGVDGPEYDVYVQNFVSDYGWTTFENPVPDTPQDDYTSYIEMDNDFLHTPTPGLDAMRVTAAHEFFHMVQFGYGGLEKTGPSPIFLFEATATWMEDAAYDDINDYYHYLSSFFENPDLPFHWDSGLHMYGLATFFHMLSEKYDAGIIKTIWQQYMNAEAIEAVSLALQGANSNLGNALADYSVWNIFTGSRADTIHFYSEGKHYPEVKPNKTFDLDETLNFNGKLPSLATDYLLLRPQISGNFAVHPSFAEPFSWIYSVVHIPQSREAAIYQAGGNMQHTLEEIRALSEIWVLPTNIRIPASVIDNDLKDYDFTLARGEVPIAPAEIISIVPNPFYLLQCPSVSINFNLDKTRDDVLLAILDENGKRVREIMAGLRPDGYNTLEWDGRNARGELVSSGIYIIYIKTNKIIGPAKLAVIR